MSVDAGQGFVDILPRTDKFLGVLNAQVTKSITSATKTASTTSQKLLKGASLGFIALGAAAVAAIGKGIQATTELAAEVRSLQRVTGQTAESASAFIAAGAALGIGVDKLTVGFGLLSKNVENAAPNFTKYGIAVKDANGATLPFDSILTNVINRFQELPENSERAAFAMNVFGRSGRTLIPILSKGVAGLEALKDRAAEMGLVMSQDDVDAAKALSIAQNELGEAFKGASIAIGKDFLPIATTVVHAVTDLVTAIQAVPQPLINIGLGFLALTGAVAALTKIGGFFISTWSGVAAVFNGSAAASATATAAEAAQLAATEALTVAAGGLTAALAAESGAQVASAATAEVTTVAWTEETLAALNLAAAEGVATTATTGLAAAMLAAAGPILIAVAALAEAFIIFKFSGKFFGDVIQGIADGTRKFSSTFKDGSEMESSLAEIQAALRLAADKGITFQAALQQIVPTADDVTKALTLFSDTFPAIESGLDRFAEASGQDISAIQASIASLSDPALQADPTKFLAASTAALDQAKAAWAAWHDSVVENLGGASGAVVEFIGDQNVSFAKLSASLKDQSDALKEFGADFAEVSRIGGKGAQDFLQTASENGLEFAGILDAVADKPRKVQEEFLKNWGKVNSETDSLASNIQKALDPVFDKVILALKNIVRAINGLPPIKLKADTGQANAAIDKTAAKIKALTDNPHVVDIFLRESGRAAEGGILGLAKGGIIPHGATGFIAKRPVLVGEGNNPTFAGRGAEAVVPFDQRGIGILAEALEMALSRSGGGGSAAPETVELHVHSHLDGKEVAHEVTRHQMRGRMVKGR